MDCNPASARGHHYIIMVVDYFTKWDKAMPTIKSNGEIAVHFVFNQIINWFSILKELVTYHGRHFQKKKNDGRVGFQVRISERALLFLLPASEWTG